MMMPSSTTRLVEAISKAIATVKSAPLGCVGCEIDGQERAYQGAAGGRGDMGGSRWRGYAGLRLYLEHYGTVLRETDDDNQQPDQDHEGPEVPGHVHRPRVQPELGDREAEPGECERGPDVGQQRAVVRQQIPQPGAVVGVHERSSAMSSPRTTARTVRAPIAPMKTVINVVMAMA